MVLSPDPQSGKAGLMTIESGLTALAVAVAFGWPRIGSRFFLPVEKAFGQLARRRALSVAVVALTAVLLRLAILPLCPIPHPFVPDDFSFLLAGDTFASGRLTNPTPAMWVHFESIHISMHPTYMSMYFPAQGLLLAAAKVLTGHPWFGLLLMSGLMCGGLCWMLQAWLPPAWALLGGMVAVLHLGLFSYWINSYTGGGVIAAFGGALVLGALPRCLKTPRLGYTMLLAIGVILLAGTRPYEGLLLCLPVAAALGRWLLNERQRPSAAWLLRISLGPMALLLAAAGWMGYYNYRAFGSPLTLPYTVDRNTYARAPYFLWQSARPEPVYRHEVIRRFYDENELPSFESTHTHFFSQTLFKAISGALFFSGIALLPPLVMVRRVLRDRRTRFLVLCLVVMSAGMLIQIFFIPHYVAPFTAVFYALGLQAMRHLRLARLDGRPVGLGLVRLMLTVCLVLAGARLFAGPLHLGVPERPASNWLSSWYGPGNFGTERAETEARLEQLPGKQLVIVRYSPNHYYLNEWVYNAADIDNSKVIWAREMDVADNLELMRYYHDRQVWLVEADKHPATASPYTVPGR
jgi:hypothetical protein